MPARKIILGIAALINLIAIFLTGCASGSAANPYAGAGTNQTDAVQSTDMSNTEEHQ